VLYSLMYLVDVATSPQTILTHSSKTKSGAQNYLSQTKFCLKNETKRQTPEQSSLVPTIIFLTGNSITGLLHTSNTFANTGCPLLIIPHSGGSRNLERGVQSRVHEAHPNWIVTPNSGHINAFVIHLSIVATDW